METLTLDYLDQVLDPFVNPRKRVFVGYLFASFIIAISASVFCRRASVLEAARGLLSHEVWWSRSARADYQLLLINQAMLLGLTPRLVSKLAVATLIFESLHLVFDGRLAALPTAPGWAIACLLTVTMFILDDAAKYLVHRALHKWPVLWCFHQVHHSAATLTPLTVYRTHPVESLIFALRGILVQSLVVACFIYFFGERAELLTVLGANLLLFIFNVTGSNLRHSHIWISYGRVVEHFFVSPAQHQIHHSVDLDHHDRNFGAVLAIWDWLGGSLCIASKRQTITFGVKRASAATHDLKTLYITPFFNAARCVVCLLPRKSNPMSRLLSGKTKRSAIIAMVGYLLSIGFLDPDNARADEVLNIYSHRQPFLIQPFIDAYKAKTGTSVNVVFASKGLAQRLQAEGGRSPADVILTVDIARLNVYADKNLLESVRSKTLERVIPSHLRDPNGRWFAFSKRARVIAVSKEASDTGEIARYEDLANPKWRGRICSRPGSHVYNRALIASFIDTMGVEKTEAWARGVVDNLARRPQGNDRAQVKAIYEGVCDIAIINNYYFGKLKHSAKESQRAWADAVRLIFPNQADRGSHVNISGGGVAKHSKNKREAIRFLEFLTSNQAQELYGAINFEYPVNPDVPIPIELRSWGTFKEDQMPISRIAKLAPDAQKIIDRVRW